VASLLLKNRDYGIRPVPPSQRSLSTWDTFVLWADLGTSFLVMVVGMFLVPGLGLGQALLAILVGALIGNLLLGIAATVGSDTGLPTMVLLRGPLGRVGSYAPTVLNVLQLIGWAALEVIVMAQAADVLAVRFLGLPSAYRLWVLAFTVLTAAMALGGPVVVTKQYLEKFAVWVVLATTVWVTGALLLSSDVAGLFAKPGTGEMPFWLAVDLVVALPISWFPLVADYTRFSRTRGAAFWGAGAGYFVPQVWFYALGATLVLALGVEGDPNAPVAPLLGAFAGLTAGWLALLVLLVDEADEGFANVYSTAVSIRNLFPQLSHRALVVGVCAVVLVIGWLVPLAQYESFLLLIGAAFVPLLGVLLADYFVLRGRRYDADLLAETASVGRRGSAAAVSWAGVLTWLLGVAVYLAISGLPAFNVQGLAPSLGATLPSFVVAFVLHVVLGRAFGTAARRAAPTVAG